MAITRDTIIGDLGGTASFFDWWTKENTEIIEKLNLLKVFGLTAGSGIGVTSNSTTGVWTVSFGGTGPITTDVTFSGKVNFDGPTILPNVSYKITGITSGTPGFTFGTPIYFDSTVGYTASKANSQQGGEMIGMITQRTQSYSTVTVTGKIDGDFQDILGGGGATLSAGCVYFLSDSALGKITTTEPTTSGSVSKPALYAIGATSGVVLSYRGNYLDSSGLTGASGGNRFYISIPTVSNPGFLMNSVVSYNPSVDSTSLDSYLSTRGARPASYSGWFLSRAYNSSEGTDNLFFGSEEDYVVGIVVDVITSGGNSIFWIVTHGEVGENLGGEGVYQLSNTWNYSSSPSSGQIFKTESTVAPGKIIAFQYEPNRYTVVNSNRKAAGSSTSASVAAITSSTTDEKISLENVLLNGDFSIWQRDVGKNSGYTGTEDLIFADMWRRVDGVTASATKYFSIERKRFSDADVTIEGSPEYYIEAKAFGLTYSTLDDNKITIGHVIPNAKSLFSSDVTLSFYAKCETNGYKIKPYYRRYNNSTALDTYSFEDIFLTTSWARHDVQFTILTNAGISPRVDDYLEIGFDLFPITETAVGAGASTDLSTKVGIASVCLLNGQPTIGNFNHNHGKIESRLLECQKYYYRSYPLANEDGDSTMVNAQIPEYGVPNHLILPTQPCNYYAWPTKMRTTPTVSVYSPSSGAAGAFNETSGRDCKNSGGMVGYNGSNRLVKAGLPVISTSASPTGVRICADQGIVIYDRVFYHIVADADFPLPN